jgi:hypothetical protein
MIRSDWNCAKKLTTVWPTDGIISERMSEIILLADKTFLSVRYIRKIWLALMPHGKFQSSS